MGHGEEWSRNASQRVFQDRMSASVVLDGIWIGPVTDPASSIRFYGHAVPRGSSSRRGGVQEFSNNYQSWSRPGRDETFVMRFTVVPRDVVEILDSWAGRTLFLRDLKSR